MGDSSRPPAISDYAIIGDCRSAALVSRDGAIDWLCWPRFDSPSIFAAILDQTKGGSFSVRPTGRSRTTRRYIGDTNVLETTFRTDRGTLQLVDLMPVASEAEKRRGLRSQHEILRLVECLDGEIQLAVAYAPRPEYAQTVPRLEDRGPLGIHYENCQSALVFQTDIPVSITPSGGSVLGIETLRAGDRRVLSLSFGRQEPVVLSPLGDRARVRLRQSLEWWERWSGQCTYQGPYRAAVVRSALVLKLLTFAPSGAVVAAPTTSLPEHIGGVRNWDYRYCWLRDASLTLQALFDLGYPTEAEAFLAWLLHSTRMTHPGLRPVYTVYGEHRLKERTLDYLDGFAGSRPVRVGNAAVTQLQLDLYGEVLDAVYQFVRRGGHLDRMTRRLILSLGKAVQRLWKTPDQGIWEIRSAPRHHTFSKAMCWIAIDRLLKLNREAGLALPTAEFVATREEIGQALMREGFNPQLKSYVLELGGSEVDASLLRLGRHGFLDPSSSEARGTLELVIRKLGRNGLVYRYLTDDGLPQGEGAFVMCSFWAVTAENAAGDRDAAIERFEQLLGRANDVGLYAEEIDPVTGAQLGNFPQAFSHVGLIDAALALADGISGPARTTRVERARAS